MFLIILSVYGNRETVNPLETQGWKDDLVGDLDLPSIEEILTNSFLVTSFHNDLITISLYSLYPSCSLTFPFINRVSSIPFLKHWPILLWDDSFARVDRIHIHVSPCNLTPNLISRFYFSSLDFNITFPKLSILTFDDSHWVVTTKSVHLTDWREKVIHIWFHSLEFLVDLTCTPSSFVFLAILFDTFWVTNCPFWEEDPEGICGDNMFPLNTICSFIILLWNISTWREVRGLTFKRTTTVESDRMILVDLSEVLLGLGERGNSCVLR